MKSEIIKIETANQLPDDWDLLTDHYFQQKEFLFHTENYNPCNQRYYLLFEGNVLKACAIIYTHRLDILTYMKIKSPIKMHVCGVPCSVSCPGIFGKNEYFKFLINFLFIEEKGLLLFLNLEYMIDLEHTAIGKTLPTIVLENRFNSWEEYVSAFRSDYRRRMNQIIEKQDFKIEKIPIGHFSSEMYSLYLQVFKKSTAKLEKLSLIFFKNLPEIFKLRIALKDNQLLGWNITLTYPPYQYFFLGGIDYSTNKDHSTYLFLLSNIVREGIENQVKYIELGQTAEIPKMRFGGQLENRFMMGRHSNRVFNYLLRKASKKLEYHRDIPDANVFKEGIL